MFILCSVLYTAAVWGVGKLFPSAAEGFPVDHNGKTIGYQNIGQKFTADRYFQGRPSAVDYNAAVSGATNFGPTNPDYISAVQARVDTFMKHNPDVKRQDIPIELLTTSGSGLDPHIPARAAVIQIPRIAALRGLQVESLDSLVKANIEKPLFGFAGPAKINVLSLNLALDALAK
jgi:K+-transporting ATPase ATPase C chain